MGKIYEVIKSTKAPVVGIGVGGKMLKFGKRTNAFTTRDSGKAREIEELYGSHSKTGNRSVVVCEVDDYKSTSRTFSMPQAPWKRGDDASEKRGPAEGSSDGTGGEAGGDPQV